MHDSYMVLDMDPETGGTVLRPATRSEWEQTPVAYRTPEHDTPEEWEAALARRSR